MKTHFTVNFSICLLFAVGACAPPEEVPPAAHTAQTSALGEGVGELLRDISTYDSFAFQSLKERAVVGATLYFSSIDLEAGEELWKTDGTAAGTVRVKDIRDVGSSSPRQLTAVASRLYFSAEDDTSGRELWVSDGTQEGTLRVKDVRPGAAGSAPTLLTQVGGTVFFVADDGLHGAELWKTDGTEAGTVLVKDIAPGGEGSAPQELTHVNGVLFFTADDGTPTGRELWKSDGTADGTVLVKDIYTAPGSSAQVSELTAMGGKLYFRAVAPAVGSELWVSDGTADGTVLVKDIAPGGVYSSPTHLTVVANRLFFSAYDGTAGAELWMSDGTAEGTVLVKDIWPGASSSAPAWLTNVAGRLFFLANDGTHGTELWVSDGTAAGTFMTAELDLFGYSSFRMVPVGGVLFFEEYGSLYRSDGTSLGTAPVTSRGEFPGRAYDIVEMGGRLYFITYGNTGYDLWTMDAAGAGAQMVADLDMGNQGSDPKDFLELNGALFFHANGLIDDLWKTDGTPAGTVSIRIRPSPARLGSLANTVRMGGAIFYSSFASGIGEELWRTDGTQAGTVLVKDVLTGSSSSYPHNLAVLGDDKLFFTAYDASFASRFWVSDGTEAGTRILIPDSSLFGFTKPVAAGDAVYFRVYQTWVGYELWRSDGTEAGTGLLKDIVPGFESSNPEDLTAVGSTLYFTAALSGTGRELWKTDGTAAGTVLVADVRPGPVSSNAANFTAAGGLLFFTADDGVSGEELWKTDGTAAGTVLVRDIAAGPASASPRALTALGSVLYFTAADGVGGYELWKSDGTEAGTVLVKELRPGPLGGMAHTPMLALPDEGLVVFSATEGAEGVELWVTDGTAEGTERLTDIAPGPASASPEHLTRVGNSIVFSANDGEKGREPWRIRLAALRDTTPPSITCPEPLTAEALRPEGVLVFFSAQATDEGSTPRVTYSIASGSLFPLGETTVTAVAKDGRDLTAQCTFKVTVQDTTPPSIVCQDVTAEATSPAGAPVTFAVQATDAASTPSVTYSIESNQLFPLGTTTVTATARDPQELTAQCTFQVLVQDKTPPAVQCPGDVSVEASAPTGATVTYEAATATDAVTTAPTVSYSHPSGARFPLGTTQVTVTASDDAGNQAQCRFNVSVTQEPSGSDSGCGCSEAGGANAAWYALLLICWAAHWRRRGSPSRRAGA
jgi:large repetitive protein